MGSLGFCLSFSADRFVMAGRSDMSVDSPPNRVTVKKADLTKAISLAGPSDADLLRNSELEKVV